MSTLLMVSISACDHGAHAPARGFGGSPQRGARLIAQIGCGSCHSIAGIPQAHGEVGPPLDNIADRRIIAGLLPNTPANLIRWIQSPQSVVPGNAMPDMHLTFVDARDIAAYLYTLHGMQ